MTHEELRSVVIECLRKERPYDPHSAPFQVDHLLHEVAEIARKRGLKTIDNCHDAWRMNYDTPELHPNLMAPVWDIVWDLIVESVLRPGTGTEQSFSLPEIHITEHGKKVLKDHLSPYDPEGYLQGLCDKVPNVDSIIVTYLAESVETLRRNCLLSSTVTMGCASEQAMLLLFEKTVDTCDPVKQTALQNALDKHRSIKQQNNEYRKWYEANLRARLKHDKGNDWASEMENALLFLFNHFRIVRNDAGHPTGTKISREEATANLVVFPRYLELIYDMIAWLDANRPI